jgi:hypothetical protein
MLSLRTMPVAFRALFSSFLALVGGGYLMALSLLFLVDIQPHEATRMTVAQDISDAYHGMPNTTRLEAALKGPMANMAPPVQRDAILAWIHAGASQQGYAAVEPTFSKICATCHNPSVNPQLPPLTSFENVQKLVQTDTGMDIVELARVSHIHLFGISIIFLLTGAIFALSEAPAWLRVSLVVAPYLSILMDIGSWWGTKYLDPLYAYIVIAGGALMGVALAAQIVISIWQMWDGPIASAFAAATGRLPQRPAARSSRAG